MLQLFPKSYRANQRVFIMPLIVDLLEELIICLTYFPRSAMIPGQLDFFQYPIPLKESILPFPHSYAKWREQLLSFEEETRTLTRYLR